MPNQLQIPPTTAVAPALYTRPQSRVLIRQKWTDAWATAPYLEAAEVTLAAAPSMPTARLRYRAGVIKREDEASFRSFSLRDLTDWFVRVEVLGATYRADALFTGRIVDRDEQNPGSAAGPTRDHELTAYGLAHDLDRAHVFGAYVTNDGNNARAVEVPIAFNDRYVHGFRDVGNRSGVTVTGAGGKKAYAFAAYRDNAFKTAVWSARDIVEYLLANYAPKGVPWVLGGLPAALSVVEPPRLETGGMTVWQLLNELVDRRRGLGFTVECPGEQAVVTIFTTVGTPATIDKQTLPANPNKTSIDLDDYGHLVDVSSVRVDGCQRYDRIRVNGSPVVACFTVGFEDKTLVKGWTDQKETDYKAGAGADGTAEKNDAERATDKFEHVFSKFLIPEKTWNWTAGGGESKGGAAKKFLHFSTDADGRLVFSPAIGNYRTWGHTLLRHLPLLKDQRDQADPEGQEPEYRDPLVFVYDEQANPKGYRYADNGSAADDVAGQVRMLDREFGFTLKTSPNHLLALNHWDGAKPTKHQPDRFDYAKLIATVAARLDALLSVDVKVNPAGDRYLVIELPDAETWFVLENTVLELTNGAFKRQGRTQVLRDDSARVRAVAAFAKAWCSEERSVLTLPFKSVWTGTPVGYFVTTVRDAAGQRNVNSVVSQITYDLDEMHTQVQTNYGELDFAGAAGGRGGRPSLR
jgi:hypothetical protein